MKPSGQITVTFPEREGEDITASAAEGMTASHISFAAWALIDLALINARNCGCPRCQSVVRCMQPIAEIGPKLNAKAPALQ